MRFVFTAIDQQDMVVYFSGVTTGNLSASTIIDSAEICFTHADGFIEDNLELIKQAYPIYRDFGIMVVPEKTEKPENKDMEIVFTARDEDGTRIYFYRVNDPNWDWRYTLDIDGADTFNCSFEEALQMLKRITESYNYFDDISITAYHTLRAVNRCKKIHETSKKEIVTKFDGQMEELKKLVEAYEPGYDNQLYVTEKISEYHDEIQKLALQLERLYDSSGKCLGDYDW